MRRELPLVATLALAALCQLGCARLQPIHYYVLESPARATLSNPHGTGVSIGVETFRIDAPYDQDRIVYRIGDSREVGFYAYHRWAAPLARMLPASVADALAGTPGVRVIEPRAPGRHYNLWLGGRLMALEEVDRPTGQHVRLRLGLYLRRADGSEAWARTLSRESVTRTEAAGDIVTLMNAVLDELLAEVRVELERVLAESR